MPGDSPIGEALLWDWIGMSTWVISSDLDNGSQFSTANSSNGIITNIRPDFVGLLYADL